MVGYIGPNGAGKSSTIKILSGILTPDCGECRINGRVPWENRIRHVAEIGVVFGQRSQLWWDVPVADSFELLKDIYQIDEALYRKNRDELTELLNLSQLLRTPARQLPSVRECAVKSPPLSCILRSCFFWTSRP